MNSGRFEVLQAYRAFAALGVVLHHINGKLSAPHYFGTQVPDFFSWGQIGVDFFFVLSGFIIAMCTQRARSAPEFLMNRALRIYPPFWLAFGATLIVALALASRLHTPVTSDVAALIAAAMLIPQPDPPVIGVAWTLHHELLFYAITGAWLAAPRVAGAMAALLLLGSLFPHESFGAQFIFSPFHWEFAAGVLAFAMRNRISTSMARPVVAASSLGAAAVVAWMWSHDDYWSFYRYATLAVLFGALIAASTRLPATAIEGGTLRVAIALGASSYTLYLWHIALVTPLTKLARMTLAGLHAGTGLTLIVVVAAATAATAHAIYRFIELPTVNAVRKRIAASRAALAANRSA